MAAAVNGIARPPRPVHLTQPKPHPNAVNACRDPPLNSASIVAFAILLLCVPPAALAKSNPSARRAFRTLHERPGSRVTREGILGMTAALDRGNDISESELQEWWREFCGMRGAGLRVRPNAQGSGGNLLFLFDFLPQIP